MNLGYDLIKGEFQHIILEGSAYEVGKMQGQLLKDNDEMRLRIETTMMAFLKQFGHHSSGKPNPKSARASVSFQLTTILYL